MIFKYDQELGCITNIRVVLPPDPTEYPIHLYGQPAQDFVEDLEEQEVYIRRLEEAFVKEYQANGHGSESMARYALNLIRNGVK